MARGLFILLFLSVTARAEDRLSFSDYRKLGPIDAIVLTHKPDAPTIVYIHGYGGTGLSQYEQVIGEIEKNEALRQYNWIFPDNPGFSVTVEDFDLWQREMVQTRKAYDKMLKAAKVDPSQVIWGGFSMGGFTAIDYVLHAKTPPKGLMISGAFYYEPKDLPNDGVLKGVPFFQSHDPELDLFEWDIAKKAEKHLLDAGLVGKIEKTNVAHNIPPGFLTKAVKAIGKCRDPYAKVGKELKRASATPRAGGGKSGRRKPTRTR